MQTFTVIYTIPINDGLLPVWEFFRCQADDAEHAEEQCFDAYPMAEVLWVNLGESTTMEEEI